MKPTTPLDQPTFKALQDQDGYYRDGLDALRLALVWIREADDRDECGIPLPDGAGELSVEFNGGVPFYLTTAMAPTEGVYEEITAGRAVEVLEGGFHQVDGVPVDPRLPDGFGVTPNDERPESHQIWWHRPFIVTDRWEPVSWGQYRDRLTGLGHEVDYTPEQWSDREARQRREWFKHFPSGVRYDVRCLDGGAWDRPTDWGIFGTLSEAIECAKTGPLLRTRGRS